MTSFFVVPSFAPPTLEQLQAEPDEVSLIVGQEAKIHQELSEVRDYHREAEPLGVIAAEDLDEEDEALTSDEELSEEGIAEGGEEGDDLDDGADDDDLDDDLDGGDDI